MDERIKKVVEQIHTSFSDNEESREAVGILRAVNVRLLDYLGSRCTLDELLAGLDLLYDQALVLNSQRPAKIRE